MCSVLDTPLGILRSRGRLSPTKRNAVTNTATPSTASTTKIPRQDTTRSIWAPMGGARIGAR